MAFQQVNGSFNVITDCALTTNVCRTTQAATLQKPIKGMVVIIDNGYRCQYGCINEFKRFTTIHSIEKWLLSNSVETADS
jgi:hypothetical protein